MREITRRYRIGKGEVRQRKSSGNRYNELYRKDCNCTITVVAAAVGMTFEVLKIPISLKNCLQKALYILATFPDPRQVLIYETTLAVYKHP